MKDVSVPIKYVVNNSVFILRDRINDARDTGKYNINVYLSDVSFFKLHSKHPTRVIPDLDKPGTNAII